MNNNQYLRCDEGESLAGRWGEIFGRQAPLSVEIGSGFGHFMREYCAKNRNINFVGIDYKFKRSFKLAKKLAQDSTTSNHHLKSLRARGERLPFLFGPGEVHELFCFFPDPWPKRRHNKRRLFQLSFLRACHQVLKKGGKLFLKTDHGPYAEWIDRVVEKAEKEGLFDVELATHDLWREYPDHFLTSFKTKFEKIFLEKKTCIKAYVLSARGREKTECTLA